jgi:septum formation protein
MNFNIPIILASNSPRRQELLAGLGVKFEVKSASVSEEFPSSLSRQEVPEFLAKQKAEAMASLEKNALIIAADTVVILDNTILGKPIDLVEAREFLKRLSGRKHQVVTGVCLKYQDRLSLFRDITEVTFGDLTAWEINHYLEKYQPLDKAGAYGIQEWIGMVGVTRIEGSYFNVVGLPVQKLYRELVAWDQMTL